MARTKLYITNYNQDGEPGIFPITVNAWPPRVPRSWDVKESQSGRCCSSERHLQGLSQLPSPDAHGHSGWRHIISLL